MSPHLHRSFGGPISVPNANNRRFSYGSRLCDVLRKWRETICTNCRLFQAVFNPVKEIPDPVVHVEEKDDQAIVTEIREPPKPVSTTAATPTTTSRRIIPASPDDIPTGSPFSPIPKPGIVAGEYPPGCILPVPSAVISSSHGIANRPGYCQRGG